MTIEKSFYTFISGVAGEIHPWPLPERITYPAVTYQLASSRPQYSADGPSNYPVTIQVDCWALSYAGVKTLQSAVRTLLDGYSGVMGDHHVHQVEIEGEVDGFEPDTGLYRVTMFINVFYRSQ